MHRVGIETAKTALLQREKEVLADDKALTILPWKQKQKFDAKTLRATT